MRRTVVDAGSISTRVASKGGSITAPTVNWSSGPDCAEQRAWICPLRTSVGRPSACSVLSSSPRLIRSPAYGRPTLATRDASDSTGKCDATTTKPACARPVAEPADVLRRGGPSLDLDTGDGDSVELERIVVEQADPVRPRTVGELGEADVVVPVHGRERRDVRGRQPGEDVLQVAEVRELHAVAEDHDEVDVGLGEPCERGIRSPVELLRLEWVDPA